MTATITPHNLPAERAVLGILIDAPARAAGASVTPGDLDPASGHDAILAAILNLAESDRPADPVLLLEELSKRDQLNRIGDDTARGAVYLTELVEAGRNAVNLPYYAQLVRAATVRRRLHDVGVRLVQTAASQADTDVLLDGASELSVALQMLVDDPIDGDAPIPGLSPARDFIDEPSPPHSWVIPGLIEHADRVLMVAGEGAGKSTLSRQIAVLLAAGRHPFASKVSIPPKRVLLIDLENPPALVRRSLRAIVVTAEEQGYDLGDRLWRWNRPGGLDLRTAAGKQLFLRAIDQAQPDLVCVGPLYKMSLGRAGDSYEIAAAETATVLDQVRERYGCAFWIEHHMAKGDASGRPTSPFGSSYWMRWPEFGLVLRRAENSEPNTYQVARFRGDRDERAWPTRLLRAAGRWPWTPDYDDPHELDRALAEEMP